MRIGINAQILTDGRTGVTRFAKNIIRALPRCGADHEFIIFGNKNDVAAHERNVTVAPTSPSINSTAKRILWEQMLLPQMVRSWNVDVMFYPDYTVPIFRKGSRIISTFHDASPLALPSTFSVGKRYYKRFLMNESFRLSDSIIADSNSTKMEMAKYFPTSDKNISVVHNGIEESFARIEDERELLRIKNQYRLSTPLILFVGTVESRKNVLGLLRAFAQGRQRFHWPHTLVLVGGPGHGYGELLRTISQERIQNAVVLTGYAREEDLPIFYTLADVFVYPSFYEGFGFPPLEAMKCGCPVIASNTTSLPEIVADAGILIDPYQPEEIVTALNSVLTDQQLRNQLRFKGIERSKVFTWEKTAQGILGALTSL